MSDWKLEHLRLTVFPDAPVQDQVEHWNAVLGASPENDATQRYGNLSLKVAESVWENGAISLRINSDGSRIDWLVGRVELLTPSVSQHPVVGEVDEYLPIFWKIVEGLAENACLPAKRIALGSVLLRPVTSREAGYEQLGQLLSSYVKIDPASFDFRYQVNRPRPSSQIEGRVNRISDWSVARFTDFAMSASENESDEVEPTVSYMLHLAMDISTSGERREPIPPNLQPSLVSELMNLSEEIAQEGDIP